MARGPQKINGDQIGQGDNFESVKLIIKMNKTKIKNNVKTQ